MQRRKLGRTGLDVSVLGFGCGTVGGLMTEGAPADQERAIARAIDLGINYFDTAQQYGNGTSETNLGRVLAKLKPTVLVATKVKVPDIASAEIGPAISRAIEASLKRLGRDHVDLFQLHNAITAYPMPGCLTSAIALDEVVPAMQRLVAEGKIRFFGMTGLGETAPLAKLVASSSFYTAQIPLNLLNPTPATRMPDGYPAQDYECMLDRMSAASMGGVGIRVVAGGAISTDTPHALAKKSVGPMGSGSSFAKDRARAARFTPLVAEGHAESVAALAIRYTMTNPVISTVLLGLSDASQLEAAARAEAAGRLSALAMARIAEIQQSFVGEER